MEWWMFFMMKVRYYGRRGEMNLRGTGGHKLLIDCWGKRDVLLWWWRVVVGN